MVGGDVWVCNCFRRVRAGISPKTTVRVLCFMCMCVSLSSFFLWCKHLSNTSYVQEYGTWDLGFTWLERSCIPHQGGGEVIKVCLSVFSSFYLLHASCNGVLVVVCYLFLFFSLPLLLTPLRETYVYVECITLASCCRCASSDPEYAGWVRAMTACVGIFVDMCCIVSTSQDSLTLGYCVRPYSCGRPRVGVF